MEELDRIREYFEGRADASCEPGDDRFRGNREMSLLQDVEAVTRAFSEERSRAEDAVVRGLKMAEALRAILDVVEGNVVTENESAAMNVICAIADDTLEEAAK